jgi:hypothetical protein
LSKVDILQKYPRVIQIQIRVFDQNLDFFTKALYRPFLKVQCCHRIFASGFFLNDPNVIIRSRGEDESLKKYLKQKSRDTVPLWTSNLLEQPPALLRGETALPNVKCLKFFFFGVPYSFPGSGSVTLIVSMN